MRRLILHREVLKELEALPARQFRQVVVAIFDLVINSMPHYSKQLQGSEYRRLAVGEFLAIYRADDTAVNVPALGKRNDGEIYRLLDRKM
jgi:mRNA interferase RelE/StbE